MTDATTAPTGSDGPTRSQIRRWRRYLAEERMEAATYRSLATRRSGEDREVLVALADAEGRHEAHWRALLGPHADPPPRPSVRARVIARLARIFGSVFVLAMAQRSEQRTAYDSDSDATEQMAADEHIHGEVVRGLTARSRLALAGTFRAAVFGANDGLVSNLALVIGVAATGMDPHLVLATGVAGLLAGALSMGAGEWVSVSSQKELLDASIPDPNAHLSVTHLDIDANELALVFRARGEEELQADEHAARILHQARRPEGSGSGPIAVRAALAGADTPTAAPVGAVPGSMNGASQEIGTPTRAALSSFLFFATGAVVPLIPFFFGLEGITAILVSAGVVGVALLVTGGVVGIMSGQAPLPRGLRQLLIGYGAAGITYVLGLAFGSAGI